MKAQADAADAARRCTAFSAVTAVAIDAPPDADEAVPERVGPRREPVTVLRLKGCYGPQLCRGLAARCCAPANQIGGLLIGGQSITSARRRARPAELAEGNHA